MNSDRKIYWIVGLLSLAGYSWIGFQSLQEHPVNFTVCLFKNVTGLPCPSCGTNRSVVLLFNGHITEALLVNPLGIIGALALIVIPAWITFDLAFRSKTLAASYRLMEKKLTHKLMYLPLITLVIANWIWNITKGL